MRKWNPKNTEQLGFVKKNIFIKRESTINLLLLDTQAWVNVKLWTISQNNIPARSTEIEFGILFYFLLLCQKEKRLHSWTIFHSYSIQNQNDVVGEGPLKYIWPNKKKKKKAQLCHCKFENLKLLLSSCLCFFFFFFGLLSG